MFRLTSYKKILISFVLFFAITRWFMAKHTESWRLYLHDNPPCLGDQDQASNDVMKDVMRNKTRTLTLFTTFKEKKEREAMYKATVVNWSSLKPFVQPIVFLSNTSSTLAAHAMKYGWSVQSIPEVNKHGTPFLKPMFIKASLLSSTPYYAYANGDILFGYDLMKSMKALEEMNNTAEMLTVGRRTNYIMPNESATVRSDAVHVPVLAAEGEIATVKAIDYFIVSKTGYPWSHFPNLVIGRVGYDNYLLLLANKHHMRTVDATFTITALHLQGVANSMTHLSDNNPDAAFNIRAIGKFNYRLGCLDKANYETYWTKDRDVAVRKR